MTKRVGTQDIREHMAMLEARGDLIRVREEVDPLDEMGAFIASLAVSQPAPGAA